MRKKLLAALRRHANRNALCIGDRFYTYKQLHDHAAVIGKRLRGHTGARSVIGLVANDDFATYASILAVWFSGCSYLPLSPRNPRDRNTGVLRQAGVVYVLSSVADIGSFVDTGTVTVISSGSEGDAADGIDEVETLDDDGAYTLFTSGSTGVPKGVPISNRNIDAFLGSFAALPISIGEDDRFLQMFELTFDVSVACILLPLLAGACVYTVPSNEVKYACIYDILERHSITIATLVPSVLAYLKPYFDEINLPAMKYCIVTAEASYHSILVEWQKRVPNAEIWNLYGPTEATIWCLGCRWTFNDDPDRQYNGLIPIGRPLKNVEALLIDETGSTVQPGEKGELCVAGDQITCGYVNNEKKNREVFFVHGDKRYYKTGDLCFENSDHDIMYCGRIDNQVQIQGFRVELGEIEHHARIVSERSNVAAIAFMNSIGNTEIHLFVEKAGKDVRTITEFLKSKLPPYMVPTAITPLQSFPLTASNKIDRVALASSLRQSS